MKSIKEFDSLSISSTVKGKLSFADKLPFFDMKNAALGKNYELSLVFIGDKRSRTLNQTHRNIDKPTDILSFPIDKLSGEIFISIPASARKAKEFDRQFDNFIAFLFIHGVTHLKGYDHSSRMESEEARLRKKFRV
jgi:probable rRNA maturation factor